MKKIALSLVYLYLIGVSSCGQSNTQHSLGKINESNVVDITSYTGNAFIFSDIETYRSRCFIIPVKEQDSTAFKKIAVSDGMKGSVCIQMFFGRPDLLKLVNDKNKEIISYRACNLPKDSMVFSRAFISYNNCVEMKRKEASTNSADSCNSKLVERTDSTEFFFRIYE